MDELLSAISVAFDPSQPSNSPGKQSALKYLENIKTSPDGWRQCLARLPSFASTGPREAIFWCLSALFSCVQSRWNESLTETERVEIRSSLMIFLRDVCTQFPQASFIKIKISLVLVAIVQRDYPSRWPSFFDDFLSLLNLASNKNGTIELIEILLKTLKVIDEEVVSFDEQREKQEIQRNTLIKDEMRVRCLPQLVECLYSILQGFHQSHPALVKETLETLKEYIGWIDIGLIANQRFLAAFYSFLGSSALQCAAINCVEQIIRKRMAADKKVHLIKSIGIYEVLSKLAGASSRLSDEFAEEVSSITDSLGMELINSLALKPRELSLSLTDSPTLGSNQSREIIQSPAFQTEVAAMLEACLQLSFPYFEHSNYEVSAEIVDFLYCYVRLVTTQHPAVIANPQQVSANLNRLFHGCVGGMSYPEWYEHSEPDDREADFDSFHSELNKLFGALVKAQPAAMVDVVCARLRDTIQNMKQRSPQAIEAALYCFYELPPAIKYDPAANTFIASTAAVSSVSPIGNAPGVKLISGAPTEIEPFRTVLTELFLSELSSVNFGPAIVTYQEIVWRYSKILESQPNLIGPVLSSLLDQRGIRHPFPKARSRACYALFQLLSKLSDSAKRSFRPFLDSCFQQIQTACEPVLSHAGTIASNTLAARAAIQQGLLAFEDVNFLFQSLGILIGSAVTGDQCSHYCAMALNWFKRPFDEAIANRQQILGDPEKSGHRMAALIEAAGSLLETLSKDANRIMSLAREFFQSVTQVLLLLPQHTKLRNCMITFLHTMVKLDGSGDLLLPLLPPALSALLQHCNIEDFKDFLTLFNRLILRYKAAFAPILDGLFHPVCTKLFQVFQSTAHLDSSSLQTDSGVTISVSVAHSTERSERLNLQRGYFTILTSIAQTGLLGLLRATNNIAMLGPILESELQSLTHGDAAIEKIGVGLIFESIKYWLESGQIRESPELQQFAFHRVPQQLHASIMRNSFNPDDAQQYLTLREIVKLLRALTSAGGAEFAGFLRDAMINHFQFSSDLAGTYVALLQGPEEGKVTAFLKSYKSERLKSSGPPTILSAIRNPAPILSPAVAPSRDTSELSLGK